MRKHRMKRQKDFFNISSAVFSECRKYRYALWRIWTESKPLVMFIGLNPSTANEDFDDPTIRRVRNFAKRWGYGGVYMMNCFPYISTDPGSLMNNRNTEIEINDRWLREVGGKCDLIIFAWGSFPVVKEFGRDKELNKMFPDAKALVINQDGSPRHPLYVKSDIDPVPFINQ